MFRQKKTRLKKWLIYGGSVIALLLAIGIGYAVHLYNKTEELVSGSQEEIKRENNASALRNEQVNPVEDNVSILFIGVDDSEKRDFGDGGRSDALLLATFNKADNNVKLLSIPRDTYVFIPEVGYETKINHAHAFGGAQATMETIEDFLHVPVDYYMTVNFDAFIEVVDALNGINYDVPYEISEQDSHDRRDAIHLTPGLQTLDGEEALALTRTRKYDSDVERGKRQQDILKKISEKATSASSLFKLDNVIGAIGSNMKTNLNFSDMKSFLSYATKEDIMIDKRQLEGVGSILDDGIWYYTVDEESRHSVEKELREHLDLGDDEKDPVASASSISSNDTR